MPSHIELLVIGDGHEREELEQIATEGQVGERVHFLGHIAHAELPKYLQVANIFVRPSRVEGFGNSFVEAMAAGIPVIATPVGGIVDFLYDPEQTPGKDPTGLFCHVGDPQGLAFAVRKLLEGPELVAILTRNASKLVAERYTWDLVAQRMEHEIFLPLIDSDVASIDAEGKGR
jgi:glycosyltransferase involved in cell wall biosynthesis